jgi:pimeloyl-ACP methyl ester carboxylesterase
MPSSYLLIDDLRVHYLHWNLQDDGRPAVLLHGLASNARIWELVAPHLAQAGLVLLAPDARGHGLTDKPHGNYGFETFSRDLHTFIEIANLEKPLLVGHSWGASLALDYAARFPTGPRAPSGLVLVDGGLTQLDDEPGATWEATRDQLAPPRLAGMPLAEFMQLLENDSAGSSGWKPGEQDIPIILANLEIGEDETIAPHLTFERHMQIVRAMWEFKTYERYRRVRCPVLAVPAAPAQPYSPEQAATQARKERGIERLRQVVERVELRWMADSIHDLPLQRPVELAQAVAGFAASLPPLA